MITKTDLSQARSSVGDDPAAILDWLMAHGQPSAERELALECVRMMLPSARGSKFGSDDACYAQLSFEFLKASYADETGNSTPVEKLTLDAGLAVRAKLLQDADNWNVPRYRDGGADKRREASEMEQLLRTRFGEAAVDAALRRRKEERA